MLADASNHVRQLAFDRSRCPDEQISQVGGEVRDVDLGGASVQGDRLASGIHSGHFQQGRSNGQHGRVAVVIGNGVVLHPDR